MCTVIEENTDDLISSSDPQNQELTKPARSTQSQSLLCRICFDNESKINKLIRPCSCSGSVAFVHVGCLEQWVRATSTVFCTICQDNFELVPVGMKNWFDCSFPKPLSEDSEDLLDYACTIAWLFYMTRLAYVFLRYGSNIMLSELNEAMGNGALRHIWWISFWFNFLYYGAMTCLIYDKWELENTILSFKDRSKDFKTSRSETTKTGRNRRRSLGRN